MEIEALMAPLKGLIGCEIFRVYGGDTLWEVTVEWKEPSSDPTRGEWDGK